MKLIEQVCEIHINQINDDKAKFNDKIIEINNKIISHATKGYTQFKINISTCYVDSNIDYTYIVSTRKSIDAIMGMIITYYDKEGFITSANTIYGNIVISWNKAVDEAMKI